VALVYAVLVPRDVEATKRRIRAAAIGEFAEHGLHGTTMERIAAAAGVNKERVYAYFGDKRSLLAAVLGERLDAIAEAVPLELRRLEDVGEFVGRSFDFQQTHPELPRLLLWEGLADEGALPAESARAAMYQQKVQAMSAAQRAGIIDDAIEPGRLLFMLLALVSWWAATPQMARMLTGADANEPSELERRRAAVVAAALALCRPRPVAERRARRASE